MQIKVELNEWRKKKLFVATPMYGGQAYGMYVNCILNLQTLCRDHGLQIRFSFLYNESLITRARLIDRSTP